MKSSQSPRGQSPPDAFESTEVQNSPPSSDIFRPNSTVDKPPFARPDYAGEVGRLGRYRVLKELGRGGMGAVYLAYDTNLGRKVALKVMLPRFAANPNDRERFHREAKAAANVSGDHVVTIYDDGDVLGIPYISMKYLLGSSLSDYLEKVGTIDVRQVIRIAKETASGLMAAHEAGVIHRDLKPGNLWLEAPNGRVILLDFGLAFLRDDGVNLTGSGVIMGTPTYMSPEQDRPGPVDARSDLFSLGSVLYRLCAGEPPFKGDNAHQIAVARLMDQPTPIQQLNPNVPDEFAHIIHRLLAKNPDHRIQTAESLLEHLNGLTQIETPIDRASNADLQMVIEQQTQSVWFGIDDDGFTKLPPKKFSLAWILAGVVVVALGVLLAFNTIRTHRGILVIESDDENVEFLVKKDENGAATKTKAREMELEVGDYTIELAEATEGIKLNTDRFSIKRDGRETVRVRLTKPKEVAKKERPKKEAIREESPKKEIVKSAPPKKADANEESPKKDRPSIDGDSELEAAEEFLKTPGIVVWIKTATEMNEIAISKSKELPSGAFSVTQVHRKSRVGGGGISSEGKDFVDALCKCRSLTTIRGGETQTFLIRMTDDDMIRFLNSPAADKIETLILNFNLNSATLPALTRLSRLRKLACEAK